MEQQILSQGTIIGGRFKVEALAGEGNLGKVYKARDVKIDKPVALRVIPPDAISDKAHIEELRYGIREASALTHRNIRATFGMGVEEDGSIYIASEWIEGQNLRALLTKRQEANKRFSFKGAYNIMGHLCNALTYAHKKVVHTALSPRAVMVSNAGRVKVSDWGLSEIRANLDTYAGRKKLESTFWAPEVLEQKGPRDSKADIYSLGALFYELVTGKPPERPLKAPSQLGFSKDVDAVIAKCMAPDPTQRFADAASVKSAIGKLVEAHLADDTQAETDDDLGIDVEVDLADLTAPKSSSTGRQPAISTSVSTAARGSSQSGSMLSAPGLPPPSTPGRNTASSVSMSGKASAINMGAVISGLGKSESARWMVQKDKLDHGPFTDRELVQTILLGEVIGKHQLLNMETGERKKVKSWGHFNEYLERFRLKKKEEDERVALQRTERSEKRSNAFMIVVALAVFGVIGLIVGGYFLSRTLRKEKTYTPDEMIAALESGEIKIKTGGNLIDKKRRRGRGRRRGGGAGRGGAGGRGGGDFVPGMSYDDAMNMAMELGSAKDGSGQKQLTPDAITRIMDRNVRRFIPCMAGQSIKKVSMDIAIAGDGRVMGISVKQGSAKLKKCVASKVRSIKFPTSPAPRTAASWYFEIY